jgi:hypothetical protein
VVNFHRPETTSSTEAKRLAESSALARQLRARFGLRVRGG